MKLTSNLFLGGLAACLLALPSMASSVTYTYTGNDFETATSPYTTSDFVSGSFTLPTALGDNLVDDDITSIISSYSFTDGVETFSSTSDPAAEETLDVSTNSTGAITAWSISLATGPPASNSVSTFSNSADSGELNEGFAGLGTTIGDPGTWAETVNGGGSSPVPEPGSVALIAFGLVGIGLVRRKLQRHQPAA